MNYIRLKRGVDARGIHPHLWFHLGVIGLQHYLLTNHIMVVTSLRRPYDPDKRPSKHRPKPTDLCTGADVRRWYLDDAVNAIQYTTEIFCKWIQQTMGDQIGVVLEPDWLTAAQIAARGGLKRIEPHIHLQSKRTRLFNRLC